MEWCFFLPIFSVATFSNKSDAVQGGLHYTMRKLQYVALLLDSSSPQTKPKLREVRALMSRKWRGSWPHISAPSNSQHAAMSASGPEPNVGAEPLAQAVPGRCSLLKACPACPASFLAMKPHTWACCPPTNITLVCVGWWHIGKLSLLWQAAILETFLIQTWLELSF